MQIVRNSKRPFMMPKSCVESGLDLKHLGLLVHLHYEAEYRIPNSLSLLQKNNKISNEELVKMLDELEKVGFLTQVEGNDWQLKYE